MMMIIAKPSKSRSLTCKSPAEAHYLRLVSSVEVDGTPGESGASTSTLNIGREVMDFGVPVPSMFEECNRPKYPGDPLYSSPVIC